MGDRYKEIRKDVDEWSALGYRVLLVAEYDRLPEDHQLSTRQLQPLALVTLTNRIRPEAPETFRYFAQQGVAIKVISGDNPATVSDVARRAGIAGAENYIDATTLTSDKDLYSAVEVYTVFGRVTPDQKKKLVQALKKRKHTVAMTGDGVNDVLAMKEAHCGIAMASGAQAASQVAQLVLLENNFAAMPGIVDEGRRVINNIQRSASLFLVKNIFSFFLSVISIFTALPYPLIPLHLSVISTFTIGVPAFFLAMEPNHDRLRGRFLAGAFRRAFPGGLTNIFVVGAALAFMKVFGISLEDTSTICSAILSIVGLLALFQICKPMALWRGIVWSTMAAGLLVCFTVWGAFFSLRLQTAQATLILVTLLIMTPTVFFAMLRLFDWGDRLMQKIFRRQKEEA
jgi:cation-transporting ATPase E